jgi:hypothetical protein
MARRTAWLHVGLPGTGADALWPLLTAQIEGLHAQGFDVPAVSREELFRAGLEIRREHKAWGYRRAEVEGSWAAVCRRAHRSRRQPLVVSELLAGAAPDQIDLLLDGLAPLRTHVVVSLRDPVTQVLDAWGEAVRSGRTASFARFAERLLDPSRSHPQARRFWADQHVGEVLARWGAAVGPRRVHVVVLPPRSQPVAAAWAGLGRATGLDTAALSPPDGTPSALDGTTVSALREINLALHDRLDKPARRRLVGGYLAGPDDQAPITAGPAASAPRPGVSEELYALLHRLAVGWCADIAEAGYDVHGDLADLVPPPADPCAPLPDQVPLEARLATTTETLARVLVEVARLREHNAVLEERNAALRAKRRRLKERLAAARI